MVSLTKDVVAPTGPIWHGFSPFHAVWLNFFVSENAKYREIQAGFDFNEMRVALGQPTIDYTKH